jgi:uncharacterized protein (DUF1330 family)
MAAYVIVQVDVTCPAGFKKYLKEVPGVIAKYGGKYVARGGKIAVLEGKAAGRRVVVIEFPSLQKAKAWYRSKEYARVKLLRKGAAKGTIIAVEGC